MPKLWLCHKSKIESSSWFVRISVIMRSCWCQGLLLRVKYSCSDFLKFSQTFYCNGSQLIACSWLISSFQSFPRTDYQYTKHKLYFFILFTPVHTYSCHWSDVRKCMISLLLSHVCWFLMVATGDGRSRRAPPPFNLTVFLKERWCVLRPSWSNGNVLVPSESECREMLLIKAALLQVCACQCKTTRTKKEADRWDLISYI